MKRCLPTTRHFLFFLCTLCMLCVAIAVLASCGENPKPSAHTHDFGAYEHDATYHWKQCTGCSEVDEKAVHSFGEWVTTLQPSTSQTGVKSRTCSVCGYQESVEIPIAEQTYQIK